MNDLVGGVLMERFWYSAVITDRDGNKHVQHNYIVDANTIEEAEKIARAECDSMKSIFWGIYDSKLDTDRQLDILTRA
jgi:hypothetical protein